MIYLSKYVISCLPFIQQSERIKMKKYAFLGAGNMAYAIIGGMGNADVTVYDKFPSQYEKFEGKVKIAKSAPDAVASCDRIFLSVKPQNFKELLSEIRDSGVSLEGKLFVSIAAGVTTDSVCAALGRDAAVIRTMPNTPLLIGCGVTALSRNLFVSDEDFEDVYDLFSNICYAVKLQEDKMNAVIAATSSAPAYVYHFIDAIVNEARSEGLEGDEILEAVCEMFKGAAEMVMKSGKTPKELIKMVTSPNGTTERAMKVLYENRASDTIADAMKACTARAEELSKEL